MTKVTIDRELLERVAGMSKRSCLTAMDELRAILANPAQQGEAVEVVGVVCVSRFKNNPAMENVEFHQSADIPPGQHDLMTVAQHQRILAAATHPADQVAEPDAELVACLKFARTTMAVVADNANLRGVEYRSLIAEIKRIDAKLASLK